jgi:hypothetical protein
MTTTTTTPATAAEMLDALAAFIAQRPRLDPRLYGLDVAGRAAYRADARATSTDLKAARAMLHWVRGLNPTPATLRDASRAYSGRLRWTEDGRAIDYTTGQFWATEFRRAACAVLAAALWDVYREVNPAATGDGIRAMFRRECAARGLGGGFARRWFD